MAATKRERSGLTALTTAALTLPGLQSHAAITNTDPTINVSYGHYQESDHRMQVDVYHTDFNVPFSDRFELSVSVDRDTYSGATPAFSLPATMTNQARYDKGILSPADIVSAASNGITAGGLTILGGLNTFQEFRDIYDTGKVAIDANAATNIATQRQTALDTYLAQNPQPPGGTTSLQEQFITLNLNNMTQASYAGLANTESTGACTDCYSESGFVIGVASDGNPTNHIHNDAKSATDYGLAYHNDSTGVYLRAIDGSAFRLLSMSWNTTDPSNLRNGTWEILGFNSAANPSLSAGNGTNYTTRTAYQTVTQNNANPRFNATFNLNNDFKDSDGVNGVWIHWRGITTSAAANVLTPGFQVKLDDIRLAYDRLVTTGNPAALAWQQALDNYTTNLDSDLNASFTALQAELTKELTISAYRSLLNRMTPPMTAIVQKYQEQPLETRTMPRFSGKYHFDDFTLNFSGGKSEEPDYESNFGAANLSHEFNNKLTTLSLGYNTASNKITRSTDHTHNASEHSDHDSSPGYAALNESSYFHGLSLGLSQVLTKNTLFQSSINYTNQSGFLSNPYKFVYIRGEVTPEEYYQIQQASSGTPFDWKSVTQLEMVGLELFREVRPSYRNLWSFSNRINQHIPELNASVHLDYRFYTDDWGIHSHTMELQWHQSLPMGLTITPNIRYYTQSQADFFAPYFLAPRADGYYSSDFRLADFGALSGGITFTKQFSDAIKLDAGFEYYTRQSGLKLGGGLDTSYADYSYYMVHGGLSIKFDAGKGAQSDHSHHHHHHGAPLPAGVMYGHMMNQAGDFMLGYRFQYANQSGAIHHGSSVASNAELLTQQACGTTICAARPTEMSMNMHMLDMMYAPTDWLNVMLMPQIMDMKMSLANIPGSSSVNEHGDGHKSGGLGDTIMAGMFKLYDDGTHRAHATLGISAPTGSTEVTMDGQDAQTSTRQDYGMQLGSGTWDFRPSITYTGQFEDWSWGAQVSGIKRLQNKNRAGYALGDLFQGTAWGGYQINQWLSASVRGIYTVQNSIKGGFLLSHSTTSTVDYTSNYGGRTVDVGFGLNLALPDGPLAGHQFSVEWLQPVADRYNGYQLEREGSLNATWSMAF